MSRAAVFNRSILDHHPMQGALTEQAAMEHDYGKPSASYGLTTASGLLEGAVFERSIVVGPGPLSSETWPVHPAKARSVGTHDEHSPQASGRDAASGPLEPRVLGGILHESDGRQGAGSAAPEARNDLLQSNIEDMNWVASAQLGDVKAFDSLVLKHSGKLYALVFQMTANHEDTNDLIQDVWTKVYRSLAGFRGAAKFTTWIHSIAVNMTINFLKRRAKRQTISLDAPGFQSQGAGQSGGGADESLQASLISVQTPSTEANISELQARLTDALAQLTPEHRAVVVMFDIQGQAHAEISSILGISEGTVRSRLFYAHRLLQGYLSDYQPGVSSASSRAKSAKSHV